MCRGSLLQAVRGGVSVALTMDTEVSSFNNSLDHMVDPTVFLGEEEENNIQVTQRTLVGKVIADEVINKGAAKKILGKEWGDSDGLTISDLKTNQFLFTFKEVEEAQKVLE